MMKLAFYFGPGDMVTKIIRAITDGPYSHVELQFSDGTRFFSSGHGLLTGSHMERDHKQYDRWWDFVWLRSSIKQEQRAERFAFLLVGLPFDWKSLFSYFIPGFKRDHQGGYCSSLVLTILQKSLHLYPNVHMKTSPNGLYHLFANDPDRELIIDVPDDPVPEPKK